MSIMSRSIFGKILRRDLKASVSLGSPSKTPDAFHQRWQAMAGMNPNGFRQDKTKRTFPGKRRAGREWAREYLREHFNDPQPLEHMHAYARRRAILKKTGQLA